MDVFECFGRPGRRTDSCSSEQLLLHGRLFLPGQAASRIPEYLSFFDINTHTGTHTQTHTRIAMFSCVSCRKEANKDVTFLLLTCHEVLWAGIPPLPSGAFDFEAHPV